MENKITELSRYLKGIDGRFGDYKEKELWIVDIFGNEYNLLNIATADTENKTMACLTINKK